MALRLKNQMLTETVTAINNGFAASLCNGESRVEFGRPWPTPIGFSLCSGTSLKAPILFSLTILKSDRLLSLQLRSLSWPLIWVVWKKNLFEWAWFDSVCVFDLNELCLKEIIRIWFINGLVWNWGRTGEKRNNVTPKKWFAIGDLWIGVIGMWLSFFVKDRCKWWKSLERKFDYLIPY